MQGRDTLLVVEDDAELRGMLRTALAFAGFEVHEAANGLEALQALDRDPPDAVILDLGLPFVSGRVVREEIAAHAHLREIPVVVITGQVGSFEDLKVSCLLRKPIDPVHLVTVVKRCIAQRGGAARV